MLELSVAQMSVAAAIWQLCPFRWKNYMQLPIQLDQWMAVNATTTATFFCRRWLRPSMMVITDVVQLGWKGTMRSSMKTLSPTVQIFGCLLPIFVAICWCPWSSANAQKGASKYLPYIANCLFFALGKSVKQNDLHKFATCHRHLEHKNVFLCDGHVSSELVCNFATSWLQHHVHDVASLQHHGKTAITETKNP